MSKYSSVQFKVELEFFQNSNRRFLFINILRLCLLNVLYRNKKKATPRGGFQIFKATNHYRFIFFSSFTAKSAA
ncbi:hypothetical protein EGI31_00700 [Lacihabitans soyangensis]|uniref:Uncharacterized protein n=1 Tax=Lacihabitans soyangensis TaxID=869394 RepID=A0AAE3KVN5_9BACT|nr:hypothetical protein [Lacihabitans soyangensis]